MADFVLDAETQARDPHFGAPPPPALRGGFNLASAAFGGRVVGAAASALDKATADNPRALFDGVASPVGYRIYPTPGAEPPAVRVEFGTGEPVPVAGFVLHPQAELGLGEGSQLRRFEIALSGDGRGFAPVLAGELPRPPREVFFPLPKPVAARAAELRLLEGRNGPGLEMALAEWSVIGVPGHPAGARLNLADPTRGGHVVRADPSLGTPEDLADLLAAGGTSPVVKVAAGQEPSLVIAFADDRAAAVTEVQWREAPAPGATAQALGDITVAAGETPWVPGRGWASVRPGGRRAAPGPGRAHLGALPAPGGGAGPSADGDWLYPSEIRVMERPVGPQTPSSLGAWGMGLAAAGREAAAPARAQPPIAGGRRRFRRGPAGPDLGTGGLRPGGPRAGRGLVGLYPAARGRAHRDRPVRRPRGPGDRAAAGPRRRGPGAAPPARGAWPGPLRGQGRPRHALSDPGPRSRPAPWPWPSMSAGPWPPTGTPCAAGWSPSPRA